MSPIFEVKRDQVDDFKLRPQSSTLFFLGPINPADADGLMPLLKSRTSRAWLTFGLFNVVIYTASKNEADRIGSWIKKHQIRWEKWPLRGTAVGRVTHSVRASQPSDDLLPALANFDFDAPPELRDAAEEFAVLSAAAVCRCRELDADLAEELRQANAIIIQAVRALSKGKVRSRGLPAISLLVDANAALSRFTSQTFSGISPIYETECHYWTHSLLGTGIATLAITKIRRFITRKLGEARIPEQVSAFRSITSETIMDDVLNDGPIWNGPWLHLLPGLLGRSPLPADLPPLAPLTSYLSGRDGYHTTRTSLSAPLNILTSCSSARWSLLTITHEMSHRVIDAVLSNILPDQKKPEEFASAVALHNGAKRPKNLLECLQAKIIWSMAKMNYESPTISLPEQVSEHDLAELIGNRREDVEEIMVHVFDFIYFYGELPEYYVNAIWRSWDAIPNLSRRLPGYVFRTLCAVLSKYWTARSPVQQTMIVVTAALEKLAKQDHENAYVQHSLDWLRQNEDSLKIRLSDHKELIGIVRTFLQSPEILQAVRGQATHSGTSRDLPLNALSIENPLRFIEKHTQTQPNNARSLWMLMRLAIDTVDPAPLRLDGIHQ